MERKQKFRIGGPKESEECLSWDIMVLDNVISEMEMELREAEKALWRAKLEMEKYQSQRTEGDGGLSEVTSL